MLNEERGRKKTSEGLTCRHRRRREAELNSRGLSVAALSLSFPVPMERSIRLSRPQCARMKRTGMKASYEIPPPSEEKKKV